MLLQKLKYLLNSAIIPELLLFFLGLDKAVYRFAHVVLLMIRVVIPNLVAFLDFVDRVAIK